MSSTLAYVAPEKRFIIDRSRVFVFGSNEAGRHGKGAALSARLHYGAIYGQGVGPQGNSYAIPTKDRKLRVLPLEQIARHIIDFLTYAGEHPELQFNVTDVGCGYAGYGPDEIAPLFKQAPDNCHFTERFYQYVRKT